MPSRNIAVQEEVYNLLDEMRFEGESFTEAIRRLMRRSRISECAGLWNDPDQRTLARRGANVEARMLSDEGEREEA